MATNGLTVDPLFVACTRPATLIGVPMSAAIVEGVFVLEIFIWTKNLLQLLWILPAHGVFYMICLREPRIFELLWLWILTKAQSFPPFGNFLFWRTSSYSPLPLQVCRTERVSKTYLP